METFFQIIQVLGYFLLLVVIVLFLRKAFYQRRSQIKVWKLLAFAWTMNLLGNIAWIIHDLISKTPLDTLSWVDLFYVSRYVLVGLTLLFYPAPLLRGTWVWTTGIMLLTFVIVWAVYFKPAMALQGVDRVNFLGLAIYPVLDAGLVVLAWLRVRAVGNSQWKKYALLLFSAMTSYGIANTINLTEYVFSPDTGANLQEVFWLLSNVFLLILVLDRSMPDEIASVK